MDIQNEKEKKTQDEVLSILKELSRKDYLQLFDQIDSEVVDKFIEESKIEVMPKFREAMTTPFSIARYLILVNQQKELIAAVNKDISEIFNEEKVQWTFFKDFSKTFSIRKKLGLNSEEKPQDLKIKYSYNEESEKYQYWLDSGTWGWEISLNQIKDLIEGQSIITESTVLNDTIKTTSTQKGITITANGLVININKE